MTNPQLIANLLAGDKRALGPHPCRGKPSWLPWGGAGAARAVADGTPAYGGSKYAQGGVGPLVLSPSKYERRVGRCPIPSPLTGEG